jgi:mono/diheme cytochrome c family protein
MVKRGRSISPTLAERLAERAELAIRHRLSEGGEVMAPFAHLNPEEVDELLAYLEYIAGVRKSPSSAPVPQRAARVGEHVVKAVCHICHDAQPAYRSREDRELPTLQDLTARYSVKQVVKKVRTGKVGDERTRGRMPTFPFLSEEEITAAYIYLAGFPPVATSVFN